MERKHLHVDVKALLEFLGIENAPPKDSVGSLPGNTLGNQGQNDMRGMHASLESFLRLF